MKYKRKLYGKIAGKCFDTSHTTDDWDSMITKISKLKEKIKRVEDRLKDIMEWQMNV